MVSSYRSVISALAPGRKELFIFNPQPQSGFRKERGQPCPRVFGTLSDSRGQGCPRSWPPLFESTVPPPSSRRPPMIVPPLEHEHHEGDGGDGAPQFHVGALQRRS